MDRPAPGTMPEAFLMRIPLYFFSTQEAPGVRGWCGSFKLLLGTQEEGKIVNECGVGAELGSELNDGWVHAAPCHGY